jgi:hypothetical protein
MTVLAVDRDPVALTLTIVSEFDAPAARVWQVWADPGSSNDGGGHRPTRPPSSTMTSIQEAASPTT